MTDKQKHVSELIDRAVLADLDLGTLAGRQDADIAADYNGCGPEWLPGFIREKLTSFLALFEPAFLIHDSDFASSDGSTFAFAQANDRLEMNCLRLSSYTYPWWSWRRYRAHLAALEIASLCRRYGWKAYCQARPVHGQGSGLPYPPRASEPAGATRRGEAPSIPSSAKTIPCMLYALLLSLALTGCMRSIEVIKQGDDWRASYTSLGLKTDVDSIEVEKKSDGFIRVKVKGLVTDVSEENKKIVDSSGAAVGTIAEKVIEGVK